ncbi:hypothetical protein Y046_6016 [Burkholderia pseudomallei MSHR2990]|nr:hypothetical protein Y046_6016 [Burkholderia pseudomallei MSHR2990]
MGHGGGGARRSVRSVPSNKVDRTFPNSLSNDVDSRKLNVFIARANPIDGARKAIGAFNKAEGMRALGKLTPTGKFPSVTDQFIDGNSQVFA